MIRERSLARRAEAIYRDTLGEEHPETATAIGNVAALLHNTGDLEGALAAHRQALSIYEAALGPSASADDPGARRRRLFDPGVGPRRRSDCSLGARRRCRQDVTERPAPHNIMHNLALAYGRNGETWPARPTSKRWRFCRPSTVRIIRTSCACCCRSRSRPSRCSSGRPASRRPGHARTLQSPLAYERGIAAFRMAQGFAQIEPSRDLGPLVNEAARELAAAGQSGEAKLDDLHAFAGLAHLLGPPLIQAPQEASGHRGQTVAFQLFDAAFFFGKNARKPLPLSRRRP